MSLTLERDKIYRARNGSLWRVVCVDAPNDSFPVIAVPAAAANRAMGWWSLDGKSDDCMALDLVAEHREPREWVLRGDKLVDAFVAVSGPHVSLGQTVRVREVLDDA